MLPQRKETAEAAGTFTQASGQGPRPGRANLPAAEPEDRAGVAAEDAFVEFDAGRASAAGEEAGQNLRRGDGERTPEKAEAGGEGSGAVQRHNAAATGNTPT